MRHKKRLGSMLSALLLSVALITGGCGDKEKVDAVIFVMIPNGMSLEQAEHMENSLKDRLGEAPTFRLNASIMFNLPKLMAELATGSNSLIILPEEQFRSFAAQGGFVNLDNTFDPGTYPEGVLKEPDTDEAHLFGVPVHSSKWFQDAGYMGDPLYAFIPKNADHIDAAKVILQAICEQ